MDLDRIFKRWDIGTNGRASWFHHDAATKIKRALRWYLPDNGHLHVTRFVGWQLLRLGNILFNPRIAPAVERMQDEIYGGATYRIDVKRLREALI